MARRSDRDRGAPYVVYSDYEESESSDDAACHSDAAESPRPLRRDCRDTNGGDTERMDRYGRAEGGSRRPLSAAPNASDGTAALSRPRRHQYSTARTSQYLGPSTSHPSRRPPAALQEDTENPFPTDIGGYPSHLTSAGEFGAQRRLRQAGETRRPSRVRASLQSPLSDIPRGLSPPVSISAGSVMAEARRTFDGDDTHFPHTGDSQQARRARRLTGVEAWNDTAASSAGPTPTLQMPLSQSQQTKAPPRLPNAAYTRTTREDLPSAGGVAVQSRRQVFYDSPEDESQEEDVPRRHPRPLPRAVPSYESGDVFAPGRRATLPETPSRGVPSGPAQGAASRQRRGSMLSERPSPPTVGADDEHLRDRFLPRESRPRRPSDLTGSGGRSSDPQMDRLAGRLNRMTGASSNHPMMHMGVPPMAAPGSSRGPPISNAGFWHTQQGSAVPPSQFASGLPSRPGSAMPLHPMYLPPPGWYPNPPPSGPPPPFR